MLATKLLRTALALALVGCSTAAVAPSPKGVQAASPPRDDGKVAKAQGQEGGTAHSAALAQLLVSEVGPVTDRQHSITVPVPDAPHWRRVRFLTVKSLAGFRYGKAHHAIVAAFVTHVDDNQETGACNKSFEQWAMPWVDAFEVDVKHEAPTAFSWSAPTPKGAPKQIAIVDIDPLTAKTATVLSRETYLGAWAAFPAWERACLVVGVAVPARDDAARAAEVRDRFVREVLPKVTVTAATEPPNRY
jgi:hypothetical protein